MQRAILEPCRSPTHALDDIAVHAKRQFKTAANYPKTLDHSALTYFTTAEKTSSIKYGRRQPLDDASCFRLSVQIGYDAPLKDTRPS